MQGQPLAFCKRFPSKPRIKMKRNLYKIRIKPVTVCIFALPLPTRPNETRENAFLGYQPRECFQMLIAVIILELSRYYTRGFKEKCAKRGVILSFSNTKHTRRWEVCFCDKQRAMQNFIKRTTKGALNESPRSC